MLTASAQHCSCYCSPLTFFTKVIYIDGSFARSAQWNNSDVTTTTCKTCSVLKVAEGLCTLVVQTWCKQPKKNLVTVQLSNCADHMVICTHFWILWVCSNHVPQRMQWQHEKMHGNFHVTPTKLTRIECWISLFMINKLQHTKRLFECYRFEALQLHSHHNKNKTVFF